MGGIIFEEEEERRQRVSLAFNNVSDFIFVYNSTDERAQ